jgi:hypothetical protein
MKSSELSNILTAIIVFTLVFSFQFILKKQWSSILLTLIYAFIIISISIIAKKATANFFDSDVEHETWSMIHFGFKPRNRFQKSIPTGIIFPLILSIISLGAIKLSTFLTYETRALKHRASKRFGFYSYTEMTDWHNALIGASGILVVLILSVASYFIPANLELLFKMSAYFAFWNIIPFSKLDGTQIFFGSKILWTLLISLSTIIAFFAFIII